jgi:hypothetical protein
VRDDASNWYSLNDDFGGTLQSKARIWLAFPVGIDGSFFAKVAPFDPTEDLEDFELIVTRRDLTESQCTTGQTTIPWAKFKGTSGPSTYTLTLSPNAS